MPNTTVGANAPSLPNRRAFLSLVSAAGAVSLAPAAIAKAAPPRGAAIDPCDIGASLDRWRRAVAATCAAVERFEAADEAEIEPPMPDKLRVQRDDWHGITSFADDGFYEDGKWIARRVYGERAADQVHRMKEEETVFWRPSLTLHPWSVKARARLEEILATFNVWEAACEEARRPRREATAAMATEAEAEDDALAQVAAAPASLQALAAKLHVFRHYYALEPADREPLEVEETTERMALAIALDVDALSLRAAAGDASANAFRPIADVARSIARSIEEARS
jgi:hypothetical protein